MNNPILNTDGYKLAHTDMYPPGTETLFSYIESRGVSSKSAFTDQFRSNPEIVHFGSAIVAHKLSSQYVTEKDFEEADELLATYGVPWPKSMWRKILDRYNGYLPIHVLGLPDGTVIKPHTPQMVIYNTDPELFGIVSHVETDILRTIWYASTVATVSRSIKKLIKMYLEGTADNTDGLLFKLHDFGARGTSSEESAMIGGLAHLINFRGTDTLGALLGAKRFFNATDVANSIPATEHSTITSWGRENEEAAYRNFLDKFGKPGAVIACVSDSYNIFNACERLWGGSLRQEVIDSGAVVVVRPDSGDPVTIVKSVIQILDDRFGHTINTKGFKVLNNVRIIQGDGINEETIRQILLELTNLGYSADNIAFGMGGALLQQPNRDTLKYAMKTSAIKIAGETTWREVYKDPVTDHGKRSKRGIVRTNLDLTWSEQLPDLDYAKAPFLTAFKTIFSCNDKDGSHFPKLYVYEDSFDEVRKRAEV